MAAPLNSTVGAFMGMPSTTVSKAGLARPVATANRPPLAMKYSSAARFLSDTGGMSTHFCSASSV